MIRDVRGSRDAGAINRVVEVRMLIAIGQIPGCVTEEEADRGLLSLDFLADTPECEGDRVSAAARAELARRARLEEP